MAAFRGVGEYFIKHGEVASTVQCSRGGAFAQSFSAPSDSLRYQQTISSTIYACLADNVIGERRTRAGATRRLSPSIRLIFSGPSRQDTSRRYSNHLATLDFSQCVLLNNLGMRDWCFCRGLKISSFGPGVFFSGLPTCCFPIWVSI